MNFCLTNAGKIYMAKVNAGEVQLHLTRAVTGSGHSSSCEILTNVVDERQQIQLDEVAAEGEYTYITCVLTNLELDREYVLRQIGLYAVDDMGVESLIIIGQDTYGDRIPLLSEKEVEYQYNIGMRVNNAAEIIFDFSVNDFLRKKYFYEHLEEFNQYKESIQDQFERLPRVKVGPIEELNRKDTILFETLAGTNKVTKILERDEADAQQQFELAAVFQMARERTELLTEDTLSTLFGKIKKYFADLKFNSFVEADNPFVLMTTVTYKPPALRTAGSLYALNTKTRGLIIIFFNRYVVEKESSTEEMTLYGIATDLQSDVIRAENPYKGILSNIVYIEEGEAVNRKETMLYATVKHTK